MRNEKLINIFKSGVISIPLYIYKYLDKLNISDREFIILMYLYNKGEKLIFNPSIISQELNIDIKEIMTHISNLTSKKLINLLVLKNDKGISEEYISLDDFFNKLSLIIMDNLSLREKEDDTIYDKIETCFARTLSPVEYEIIKAWLENGISIELIETALNEAVYNGVTNLRYIDKILFDYNKKGYRTKEDVIKNKNIKNDENVDIYTYNWLDDDEDE